MLITDLITILESMEKTRGNLPVYLKFEKVDEFYYSIEKIFPDIVKKPNPVKSEGKLEEILVLCSDSPEEV